MCDEVAEGDGVDGVEAFGWVVEGRVVDVIDRRGKLVARDGGNNEVGVPRLAFGEVGSTGCFACRCGRRCIDGIIRGSGGWDVKSGAIALEIEHWVLEEPEVSFSVSPRARNRHKVGGELLLEKT